jgi:replicative DNA helicase
MNRDQEYNVEAEQSVIGGIMMANEVLDTVKNILEPEDFYKTAHQVIYSTILSLQSKGIPIDIITLNNRLKEDGNLSKVGDTSYITFLASSVPTSANTPYYAKIVKKSSHKRKIVSIAAEMAEGEDLSDLSEKLLIQSRALLTDDIGTDNVIKAKDVLPEVMAEMEAEEPDGILTGVHDLDRKVGALKPHNLVVLAGRPGMGKSALALSIAYNVAKGKPVMIFSTEMSAKEMVSRLVCYEYNASLYDITTKQHFSTEYTKAVKGAGIVSELPIYFDHTGSISIEELMNRATKATAKYGIELIIVDYMNQMVSKRTTANRNAEVGYISMMLKSLAKQLNISVLALGQLNRKCEDRPNKRPGLADLRDSGEIENNADKVFFIYRDSVYNKGSEASDEIIVAKNKQGKIGTVYVNFIEHSMRIVDLGRE